MERKSSKLQKISPVIEPILILCAFRYALGRKTYVVDEIINCLKKYWKDISHETRILIVNDIEEAVRLSCCGDECDQNDWENFLEFAHKSVRFE